MAGQTFAVRTMHFPATEQPKAAKFVAAAKRDIMTKPDPATLTAESAKDPLKRREAAGAWMPIAVVTSQDNVGGFLEKLRSAGWNINFNWGLNGVNYEAWESDWNANNADWVDAADIVFFTGHAFPGGWTLGSHTVPTGDPLGAEETQAARDPKRDLWGNQDVEWIVISGCGPLQDDLVAPGTGNAFARWSEAFDGLHQLLGFASDSDAGPDEGGLFARYCLDGDTLIDAWFRTTKETQRVESLGTGEVRYAAVMYAHGDSGPTPFTDRLWGVGDVAPDPVNPTTFVIIWSPT
jgi:hypothetical protein